MPVDPMMCCLTALRYNLDVHMVAKTLLAMFQLHSSLAIFTRYRSVVLPGEECRSTTSSIVLSDFHNVIERNLCIVYREYKLLAITVPLKDLLESIYTSYPKHQETLEKHVTINIA